MSARRSITTLVAAKNGKRHHHAQRDQGHRIDARIAIGELDDDGLGGRRQRRRKSPAVHRPAAHWRRWLRWLPDSRRSCRPEEPMKLVKTYWPSPRDNSKVPPIPRCAEAAIASVSADPQVSCVGCAVLGYTRPAMAEHLDSMTARVLTWSRARFCTARERLPAVTGERQSQRLAGAVPSQGHRHGTALRHHQRAGKP